MSPWRPRDVPLASPPFVFHGCLSFSIFLPSSLFISFSPSFFSLSLSLSFVYYRSRPGDLPCLHSSRITACVLANTFLGIYDRERSSLVVHRDTAGTASFPRSRGNFHPPTRADPNETKIARAPFAIYVRETSHVLGYVLASKHPFSHGRASSNLTSGFARLRLESSRKEALHLIGCSNAREIEARVSMAVKVRMIVLDFVLRPGTVFMRFELFC